jgi:phage gp46-like protein
LPDIRLIAQQTPDIVTLDWLQTPTGLLSETNELITAVTIALCSDALAAPSDALPDPKSTDRRGWWGDLDAAQIWGGWPIGSKLWLLQRSSIVGPGTRGGATIQNIQTYIAQCLNPFVQARIFSSFTIACTQVGPYRIDASVVIYRGPLASIALVYQFVWNELFLPSPAPTVPLPTPYVPPNLVLSTDTGSGVGTDTGQPIAIDPSPPTPYVPPVLVVSTDTGADIVTDIGQPIEIDP